MFKPPKPRTHLPHATGHQGTVCLTWRVHRVLAMLESSERDVALDVITRTPGTWYDLLAAVIMDDHVHVLVTLRGAKSVAQIAHALKSVSSHEIVKLGHHAAPIWQAEYFDRWMNHSSQIAACRSYVLNNPQRRWPGLVAYRWSCDGRGGDPTGRLAP